MTITTQTGEVVTPLQNILNMRHNSLCRTQQGTFMLVYNKTKTIQLIYEHDVDDWDIQSTCFAIDKYGEQLPFPVTVKPVLTQPII